MLRVIDVQDTPNPDALKFILDGTILAAGVRQFDSTKAAKSDPLASALFSVPGVQSVFYMGKFVTVTKEAGVKWSAIQPKINKAIHEKGTVVSTGETKSGNPTGDKEMLEKINQILDESVKPALAGDGGGLEVMSLDGLTLTVHYQGACGSCPSSTAGTMMAIQNLLQRLIDPKLKVVAG